MTKKEKLKAINERLKDLTLDNEHMVSVLLIGHYLDKMAKKGLVEAPYSFTDMGSRVASICEEFDWEVTDEEIQQFCEELVPPRTEKRFYLLH